MKTGAMVGCVLGAAGLTAVAGAAPTFYVSSGASGTPLLYEIDGATGQTLSTVATSGVGGFINRPLIGMEFAPDGTLYGFTQLTDNRLYRVDPTTGVGTAVGPSFGANVFEGGLAIVDNTFAYGTTLGTASAPRLFGVNLQTGAFSEVASLSRSADISGLVYRSDGMLVGLDARGIEEPEQLVTIDPATGEITTLAILDTGRNGVAAGLTVVGGVGYYAYGGFSPSFQSELWSFDLFTGEQTFVTNIASNIDIQSLAGIPTPSTALVAFGAMSLATRRRR